MKTIFMTCLIVAASLPAFAKMTVFSTTDAIKLVLNDTAAMDKLVNSGRNQMEITSIMASTSEGDSLRKSFTVRIGTSSKKGINGAPCMTDVSVTTVTRLAGSPGGGPGLSSNRLVISSVGAPNCLP